MASPPVTDWAEDEVEGFGRSYEERRGLWMGVGAKSRGETVAGRSGVATDVHLAPERSSQSHGEHASVHAAESTEIKHSTVRSTLPGSAKVASARKDPGSAHQREGRAASSCPQEGRKTRSPARTGMRQGLDEAFGRISVRAESLNPQPAATKNETTNGAQQGAPPEPDVTEVDALNARIVKNARDEAEGTEQLLREDRERETRSRRLFPTEPPYRAYVGHVPAGVQEDQIRQLFHGCQISRIRFLRRAPLAPESGSKDPGGNASELDSGTSTKHTVVRAAFVDFANAESLSEALKRHGTLIDECAVVVDIAQYAGNPATADASGSTRTAHRGRHSYRTPSAAPSERVDSRFAGQHRRGNAPTIPLKGAALGHHVNGTGRTGASAQGSRRARASRQGWVHVTDGLRPQILREQDGKASAAPDKSSGSILARNDFAVLASLDSSLSDDDE
jgi:hypothetical protein